MKMRIAYQGEPGANSEAALEQYFGNDAEGLPCTKFVDVFEAVASGAAAFGAVPVENSLTGSIVDVLDLLRRFSLSVVGETVLHIEHHLLGLPGVDIDEMTEVYSHPQGLLQCRSFLQTHRELRPIAAEDTAGAARQVSEWQLRERAAIANGNAGARYGLEVVAPAIGDCHDNFTRFVMLSKTAQPPALFNKAAMIFELEHRSAALHAVLGVFADAGLNLTKIESRPMVDPPFSYWFYTECSGPFSPEEQLALTGKLESRIQQLRVLGWFDACVANPAARQKR